MSVGMAEYSQNRYECKHLKPQKSFESFDEDLLKLGSRQFKAQETVNVLLNL